MTTAFAHAIRVNLHFKGTDMTLHVLRVQKRKSCRAVWHSKAVMGKLSRVVSIKDKMVEAGMTDASVYNCQNTFWLSFMIHWCVLNSLKLKKTKHIMGLAHFYFFSDIFGWVYDVATLMWPPAVFNHNVVDLKKQTNKDSYCQHQLYLWQLGWRDGGEVYWGCCCWSGMLLMMSESPAGRSREQTSQQKTSHAPP